MSAYQSRYERTHSARVYIKWILCIGVLLCVLVFGGLWVTDYIEAQHIVLTQESFSDLERKQFSYDYGFSLEDDLMPCYTFRQGISDDGARYEGIVLDVETDFDSVLSDCFGLHPDGEEHQRIAGNCQAFFVDGDYHGALDRIRAEDGSHKAILFTVPEVQYQLFFFQNDAGDFQLMARKSA